MELLLRLVYFAVCCIACMEKSVDCVVMTTKAPPPCPEGCSCSEEFNVLKCHNLIQSVDVSLASITKEIYLTRDFTAPLVNETFKPLFALQLIDISYSAVNFIQRGAFKGLLSLKRLNLRGNNLTLLDEYMFQDNLGLEVLDLSENRLSFLPDAPFRFLPNLKVLNVSYNRLMSAKFGLRLQVVTQLQVIDVSGNQIEQIVAEDFKVVREWEHHIAKSLNFSSCGLKYIEAGAIEAFKNVEHLSLAYNPDLEIQNMSAYLSMLSRVNLRSLDMTYTNLSHKLNLSDFTVDTLGPIGIQQLFLARNEFNTMDDNVLTYLNMQKLDLSHNDLTKLDNGLANLNNLVMLDVSHNKISTISAAFQNNVANLVTLDLSYNMLTEASNLNLTKAVKLKQLDLSYNKFESILISRELEMLEYLAMSDNKLSSFNNGLPLAGLSRLMSLNLCRNKLTAINNFLFRDSPNIETALFRGNSIKDLSDTAFVPNCPKHIDLSRNALTLVRNIGWHDVISIDLSHNSISTLEPQTLYFLKTLLVFDASMNQIDMLPVDLFSHTTALTQLHLEGNYLNEEVPLLEVLSPLQKLQFLDISRNNFTVIGSYLENNKNLKHFKMSENYVSSFSPKVFRNLEKLETVDFSKNPLQCDCETLPLQDWVKKTSVKILGQKYLGYACRMPSMRGGKTLMNYTVRKFECDRYMFYMVVFSSVAGAAMALAISMATACILYKRYRRKQTKNNSKDTEAEMIGYKELNKKSGQNGVKKRAQPVMTLRDNYLYNNPSDTLIDVEFENPMMGNGHVSHFEPQIQAKKLSKSKTLKFKNNKRNPVSDSKKRTSVKHLRELLQSTKSLKFDKGFCKHDKENLKKLLDAMDKDLKFKSRKKSKSNSKSGHYEKMEKRPRGNCDLVRMISLRESKSAPDILSYVNSLPSCNHHRIKSRPHSSKIPIYHVDHYDNGHHGWARSMVDIPRVQRSSAGYLTLNPRVYRSMSHDKDMAGFDNEVLQRSGISHRLGSSGYHTIASTRGTSIARLHRADYQLQGLNRSATNVKEKKNVTKWL